MNISPLHDTSLWHIPYNILVEDGWTSNIFGYFSYFWSRFAKHVYGWFAYTHIGCGYNDCQRCDFLRGASKINLGPPTGRRLGGLMQHFNGSTHAYEKEYTCMNDLDSYSYHESYMYSLLSHLNLWLCSHSLWWHVMLNMDLPQVDTKLSKK